MSKEDEKLLPPKYRSKSYWADRQAQTQTKLTERSIKETEKQLAQYYKAAMDSVIKEFEFTYEKLVNGMVDGVKPTPADLYKLDKYWSLQGQITKRLRKLGDKQSLLLADKFYLQYFRIYDSISIDYLHTDFFKSIDEESVKQMVNAIWCADGKTWSDRIWHNTEKLQAALNEGLISCVATGASTQDLKLLLQDQFKVSYSRADSIVRTEMAHIQTQAAAQKYKDAGIQEFEVWADEDERRCDVCGKLHEKRFKVNEQPPIPAHPRCRCCILPVVEA